jgi:hypothetical protein
MDGFADVVMTVDDVIKENLEMRRDVYAETNMPFNHMLIFGGIGNGDYWFYPIAGTGRIVYNKIFVWDHETDERKFAASFLKELIAFDGCQLLNY